jgi:cell division ATPase FtsA
VQIFDAILPVLSELATELRRSLDYYRSRAAGKNVDRVILCGGTASLPGLDKFLDQELQVPVQVASPFAGLSVTTKSFDPRYLQTIAPLFTVAVGLAGRNAVFAANPLPVVKKQPSASGAGSGGKSKFNLSLPSLSSLPSFGSKGTKKTSKLGGRPDSTTLPPTG